jgi:hypothetical protein
MLACKGVESSSCTVSVEGCVMLVLAFLNNMGSEIALLGD